MSEPLQQVDYTAYLSTPSEPEVELMRLHQPDAPLIIFDIGACEGEDTVRYARRFPRARLFAFEPLPANQALVRANLARYGIDRAELVPLALSDRAGETVFHVSSGRPPDEFAGRDWNYGNKSSSLLAPAVAGPMYGWVEFKERITVRTATLDDFCAERGIPAIDFIHMDVQGAEWLVLQGAHRMLPRTGALWLEVSDRALYAGQRLRPELERLMCRQGFALARETRREIEGDQFYVNLRRPAVWPYVLGRQILRLARQTRAIAGRVRRAIPV